MRELSATEQFQAFKSDRVDNPAHVKLLTKVIETSPALHSMIIANPYTDTTRRYLQENLQIPLHKNERKAVVLAEPETEYDIWFKHLPHEEKFAELYAQMDKSAEITMNLSQYVREHSQEFWDTPPEQIYEQLTKIAFGTTNVKSIGEQYAQSQRRGYRLSIVNFTDDMHLIRQHTEHFDQDARSTINQLLKLKFQEEVSVESLPFGFVITLDPEDYNQYIQASVNRNISSDGSVTFSRHLPPELRGKIAILKRDGNVSNPKTREHEIRHILYANFMADQYGLSSHATDHILNSGKVYYWEDHIMYANMITTNQLSVAKDEIIAYNTHENEYQPISSLGDNWEEHLESVILYLEKQPQILSEEKALLYDVYHRQYVSYLERVRECQWIAQRLYSAAHDSQQPGLTEEKAEALLQNTPIKNWNRLGKYFGVDQQDISTDIARDQKILVKEFTKSVHRGGPPKMLIEVVCMYPEEALPALLQIVTESNNKFYVNVSLLPITSILHIYQQRLNKSAAVKVKNALERMIDIRTDDDFQNARTTAQQILDKIDAEFVKGGPDFVPAEINPFSEQ